MRRIPATRRTLRLVDAAIVAPAVRSLVFETVDRSPYDHLAGQWVKLYLPAGIERDYSIASAPGARGPSRIEILVTKVEGGPGSTELHGLPVGTELDSLGPSGLFVREDAERDHASLYVGTGTGVAPLRAMLEEELVREDGPPQLLLFGCRTTEDILFAYEWRTRMVERPRFRFVTTLSRGEPEWAGLRGYVQTHVPELLATLPTPHIYVCGLTRMITEVRRVLKEDLHIDRRRVHSERYD
jgi:CDP-4-dehydro-6-deoxyglucose reductase, E3